MKRFLSVSLVLILALLPLGVLAADTVIDEAGLYAEQTVALPSGYESMVDMAIAPDGAVVVVAKTTEGGWALLTWQDLSAEPTVLPLTFDGGDISSIDIAPDGQVMALVSGLASLARSFMGGGQRTENSAATDDTQSSAEGEESSENAQDAPAGNAIQITQDSMRTTVLWFAGDGTVDARFEVSSILSLTKALSGKQLAVYGYQSGITVYDASGAEVLRPDAADALDFAATASSLFIVRSEEIVEVDLAGGQKLRSIPVNSGYSVSASLAPDGTLYLMDSEGAYRVAMESGQKTRVMELTGTLMGDPGNSLSAFGVRSDGSMSVFVNSGGGFNVGGSAGRQYSSIFSGSGGGTLAVYTPLDPSLVGTQTPFTITALRSSNRLRKAVSDFQRLHPELRVTLQVQMEDNDDSPVEDHIRTLNTDLLAGKGGDVIVLDGLPADKYASKGILADLTDLLPELDLLPGIVSGSTASDGKVYAVPAQFSFQTLWGRKNQVDGIQSLEDLLYANFEPDQVPLTSRTPEEWLRLFYPSSEAAFRDEQGRLQFDTTAYEAFLETLYQLYSEQDEIADVSGLQGRGGGGGRFNMTELLAIYNGAVAFYPVDVNGLMQLSTAYSIAGGDESAFMTLPSMDGPGRAYTPSLLVGVNANSAQQALAMEFLRVVFSPDVQESDQMSGLPVARASLDKLFTDAQERSQGGGRQMFMIPGGVTMEIVQPDDAAWDALRALCDAVDTPATIDDTLMDFMVSETEGFFEGRNSARDAAYALQQRAWFYLNE